MTMPSLRTLARGPLVGAAIAIAIASPAPAQDIGSVIVLPDEPFVLPVLSSYVFPADPQSGDVLTQRANNNRDSATYVPGLNSNTVQQGPPFFRRIGFMPTSGSVGFMPTSGSDCAQGHVADGSSGILTQPLYAGSALVHGESQPVVLFVSMNNFVYAYSPRATPQADGSQRFNLLWCTSLGEPYDSSKDAQKNGRQPICPGFVGTEATPVVDLPNNRIIVSYMISDATHHIAALELNDGRVISQKKLSRPDPEWDRMHRNRAGLLLADGVVYVAMSGLCEGTHRAAMAMHLPIAMNPPMMIAGHPMMNAGGLSFFGSIFAFRASDLEPAGFFPVTTGSPVDGGGIWQASTGLAADSIGNLYVGTGNPANGAVGTPPQIDPQLDKPNFTDSVLRLKVEKNQAFDSGPPSLSFTVADYFTPYRKVWLDWADMDIAASGILLIPGTRYLVAGGKEGVLYTLDRADLGHFDKRPAQVGWSAADVDSYRANPDLPAHLHDDPARDFVHQKFQAGVDQYDVPSCSDTPPSGATQACFFSGFNHPTLNDWPLWPHIHGTPVFARFGPDAQFLFVWPEKDLLKRFTFDGTLFNPMPLKSDAIAPPMPLPNGNHYKNVCDPNQPPPKLCGDCEVAFGEMAPTCVNQTGNGMPGGMLAVNIDGGSGQGVLFAAIKRCAEDPNPPFKGHPCTDQRLGSLRAYDPFTLKEVWNDCGTGPPLPPGDCNLLGPTRTPDNYNFANFVPPTVADGRVFLATADGKVIVYGK
jgi:outer membrane protein assembly factor BamB